MACIFCEIASGEVDAEVVYENDGALAFLDISPLSEGHTLIIPKEHAVQAHEMSPDSWAAVADALANVTKMLADRLDVKAYNILQNNGEAAHQAVMHVHFHVIPKTRSGGLGLKWSGKRNIDVAAVREKLSGG
jgi:histidine triad (HIT) family protein